jgi:hypothetical protein
MENQIEKAFDIFDEQISPSDDSRKAAIEDASEVARVIASNPAIEKCILTGSMTRSTAVKDFSDVDVVAVIRESSMIPASESSSILIFTVGLVKTYWPTAETTGNTIALQAPNGMHIDILPALAGAIDNRGNQIYRIPSPGVSYGWSMYSPEGQSQELADISAKLGPSFKQLIRAVKWWSQTNGRPISSHQVEAWTSELFREAIPKLPEAITSFFDFAAARLREDFEDVRDTADGNQDIMAQLSRASRLAKKAYELESEVPQDAGRAIRVWRDLFGEQFPAVFA